MELSPREREALINNTVEVQKAAHGLLTALTELARLGTEAAQMFLKVAKEDQARQEIARIRASGQTRQ